MERQKLIERLKKSAAKKETFIDEGWWVKRGTLLTPKEARLFLELLEKEEGKDLQPLFNYLSEEHGLNLLENELHEIVRLVNN